nr:uncharacterized protein LOC109432722 [Aedes albopictus]
MEELKSALDAASFKKLKDAKITDDSLALITDEDLIDLQIELGPRKIIRNVIFQMVLPSTSYAANKNPANSTLELKNESSISSRIDSSDEESTDSSTNENVASTTISSTAHNVRQILEKVKPFRGILYNKLLANIVPEHNEICKMVFILCDSMFHDDMFNNKKNPTMQQKHQLAKDIIEAFPQLKETRPYKLAPPEAAFFWKNGGKGLGKPHTGWIETRICNKRKDIPRKDRKFQRRDKHVYKPVDPSLIDQAKLCAALAANTDNIKAISDLLKSSAPYHFYLIAVQTDARTILQTFPHFCSFSGIMLQQAYERLKRVHPKSDIRQTLIKCLSVSQTFPDVEDKIIRGALRVQEFLTKRGIKKENREPNAQSTTECFAANLIRWVEPTEGWKISVDSESDPHIICLAPALKQGDYYVNLYGRLIFCGIQSARAIDVLVKSFCVLGTRPTAGIAKMVEFLEIFTYEVSRYSTRSKVNSLVKRLQEMDDTEEDTTEGIGAVELVPMTS